MFPCIIIKIILHEGKSPDYQVVAEVVLPYLQAKIIG
jgi:hypothetical protein